jgi:hypothetical protein
VFAANSASVFSTIRFGSPKQTRVEPNAWEDLVEIAFQRGKTHPDRESIQSETFLIGSGLQGCQEAGLGASKLLKILINVEVLGKSRASNARMAGDALTLNYSQTKPFSDRKQGNPPNFSVYESLKTFVLATKSYEISPAGRLGIGIPPGMRTSKRSVRGRKSRHRGGSFDHYGFECCR